MQIKLVAKTASVVIGDREFPRNILIIKQDARETSVGLQYVHNGGMVVDVTPFGDWLDNTGAPYTTQALLLTALRAALFV